MDIKVTFAEISLKDLEEIVKFIAKDNPEKAQEAGDRLIDKALGLQLFPIDTGFVQIATTSAKSPRCTT